MQALTPAALFAHPNGFPHDRHLVGVDRDGHVRDGLHLFDHPDHVLGLAGDRAEVDVEVMGAGLRLKSRPVSQRGRVLVEDRLFDVLEAGVDAFADEYHNRGPPPWWRQG